MPTTSRFVLVAAAAALAASSGVIAGNTNNILITGYWPPTNEMVRPWSTSATQNPNGSGGAAWVGLNWEGRGYDVYAYFPEFPGGTTSNPKGNGDFEVDYQDTWNDWQRIIAEVRPVAIITNSRANTNVGWELEPAAQRFRVSNAEVPPPGRTISLYTNDYLPVLIPSDLPPFVSIPVGTIYNNTLPMSAIVAAVDAAFTTTDVDPFIQTYDPLNPNGFDFGGGFLSGYISFLGCRHKALNDSLAAQYRCVAAGHIHVGRFMTVPNATQATQITLREVITHVNTLVTPCRADYNDDAEITVQDIFDYLSDWSAGSIEADFNAVTGGVGGGVAETPTVQDIFDYLATWTAGC
jgi:hypothetical protein